MIKFIQCIRRKPDMSIQEFRHHWIAYQKAATELARAVGAAGLTFSTTLAVEENLQLRLIRGTSEPYDGITEFRISSAPRMLEKLEQEPAQTLWRDFQKLQSDFVDLASSSFFFATEDVALGSTR